MVIHFRFSSVNCRIRLRSILKRHIWLSLNKEILLWNNTTERLRLSIGPFVVIFRHRNRHMVSLLSLFSIMPFSSYYIIRLLHPLFSISKIWTDGWRARQYQTRLDEFDISTGPSTRSRFIFSIGNTIWGTWTFSWTDIMLKQNNNHQKKRGIWRYYQVTS